VEGRCLFSGKVDVIVCDGVVGTSPLKICEGMAMGVAHQVYLRKRLTKASFGIPQVGYLCFVWHGGAERASRAHHGLRGVRRARRSSGRSAGVCVISGHCRVQRQTRQERQSASPQGDLARRAGEREKIETRLALTHAQV